MSEWIWSRIGFGIIGILAGTIWCLIFYPVIYLINPDIEFGAIFKVFVTSFSIGSLINEKLIGRAGVGALYGLYGLFSGFLGVQVASAPSIDTQRISKELTFCVILGCGSALAVSSMRG